MIPGEKKKRELERKTRKEQSNSRCIIELVTAVGNPNGDKLRTCVNLGPPRRIPQDYIKHEITLLWERSVRKSEGGQIIPDYHIFQRNFKKVVGSARVKVVCQRSLMMSRSRSVSP